MAAGKVGSCGAAVAPVSALSGGACERIERSTHAATWRMRTQLIRVMTRVEDLLGLTSFVLPHERVRRRRVSRERVCGVQGR